MHKLRGALVVLIVGVLLVGCGNDDRTDTVATTTTAAVETSTTVAASSSGGTTGNTRPAATAAPAPAPVINSFETPENIDCHNGNSQTFTARWTTTNAVKSTISIDGAAVYQTYAANAEASLPFNCSSPHTFLLTAYGKDGKTATRSITLQPRNAQPDTTEEP